VTVARRLLLTYLTISVFVLAAVVIPLGRTFADREKDRLVFDIERDAQAVASLVEDALEAGEPPRIDDVLADYAHTGGRIVVADAQGVSVADSDRPEGQPRDFSTRPEFAAALDGARSAGTRASETLGTELMYVALPVASGGVVHGAVRVSYPTSTLDARVSSMWLRLAALSAVVLVTVAAVGLLLARSVTRPVRRLQAVAGQLAGGDLGARVQLDGGAPELRDLADTFNRTADRLAQLVTAQKRFVADASHQLRTPLTALELRLENLERDVTPEGRSELEGALGEVERLARLVDGLLALARADRRALAPTPVDVARAVRDRVDAWSALAAEHGVSLVAVAPASLGARASEGAVEQILDNLIANAVDVSPQGATITVRAGASGGEVALHVVDQGPGMSDEEREHAFDRFWRAGWPGEGFGLGLAIVRRLARADGGDAELLPAPGGGLDARVRLRSVRLEGRRADPQPVVMSDLRAVDRGNSSEQGVPQAGR
jgi:signal transduction histidine kinase